MEQILAFKQGITKTEFLSEIKNHQKLDNFVKGSYWGDGKGCAVGCSLESVARLKKINLSYSNHSEMERHLGVPTWLALLEDKIFEGISKERSKSWPVEFAEAINEGSDLNKIKTPFLIFICEQAREKTKNELAHSYIDGVLVELRKEVLDIPALTAARNASRPRYYAAAFAADAAAAFAADAAAADADAADAFVADAADAAADAAAADAFVAVAAVAADADAYAAAYAAAYVAVAAVAAVAAVDAAKEKQYTIFADKLLELIRNCN